MSVTELERTIHQTVSPAMTPARSSESDSALVRLAQQDLRNFAPLYERYRDTILHYCLRSLDNREDAADATQQTFANALTGLRHFQDNNDSFRCWLFRIAHNEIINRRRYSARWPEHSVPDIDWVVDSGRSPEELAILADDRTRIHVLLLRLTPEQRRCCAMRFSGLSHRETAVALGKSEVAVRASFHRGLAALRDLMSNDQ